MIKRKLNAYYIPYENNHYKGVFRSYNKITSSFNKLVKINASGNIVGSSYDMMYPFNTTESQICSWFSGMHSNASISMKFINHKMSVFSYSLKSRAYYSTDWEVEALNNAGKWDTVSSIKDDHSLKYDKIGHWNTTNQNFYSEFRIRQTAARRDVNENIVGEIFELALIEFFGILIRNEICSHRMKQPTNLAVISILIMTYS